MKIKEDLVLRNIAGDWIVVPMGERLIEFNGMMKLNESGAFIWKLMENDISKEEIIAAMLNEYDMDKEMAKQALDEFITVLSDADILET